MSNFNYNHMTLAGRITEDPELKTTPTGIEVCRFSVAYNRGKNADPDFFTVVAWRQVAERVTRYFRRGSAICVDGWLKTEVWTDKKTNVTRRAVVIEADEVHFVDSKADVEAAREEESAEIAEEAGFYGIPGDIKKAPLPPVFTPGARAQIAESSDDELPF